MCGKLPAGSVGLLPSGSAPATSGSGVPHHGGSIATAWAEPTKQSSSAHSATAPTSPLRRLPTIDTPHPSVDRTGAAESQVQPRREGNLSPRHGRVKEPCAHAPAAAPRSTGAPHERLELGDGQVLPSLPGHDRRDPARAL